MNKERLLILASFMDTLSPKRLDMSTWGARKGDMGQTYRVDPADLNANECGTSACIAGWAIMLFEERPRNKGNLDTYSDRAGRLLSLDENQSTRLFYGLFSPNGFRTITTAEAAQALRALAQTEVL